MSRILLYVFLIYISVSISFQSCSNSTEPVPEMNEVLVNVPTNNYLVKANITQIGFFGCANVTVYKDGAVTDAIVKINEVEFFYQFNELYSDTTGSMIYKVGRKYELTVSHNGVEIANGTAIMPSEPTITGLPDTSDHPANQAITVTWEKPSNASSVLILLESNINNDDDYESGHLNPTINSHTISGSEFLLNGEYKLTVIAFHGFLPGTVEDSSEGYNISGSAGEFIASNVSPTVVLRVTDGVNKQVHKRIRDKSNNLSRLLKSKDQYEFLKLLRR